MPSLTRRERTTTCSMPNGLLILVAGARMVSTIVQHSTWPSWSVPRRTEAAKGMTVVEQDFDDAWLNPMMADPS